MDFFDEERPASTLGVELMMSRSWESANGEDSGHVTEPFVFPDANWLDIAMALQLEPAINIHFTTDHVVLRQKIVKVDVEIFNDHPQELVETHVHEVRTADGYLKVSGGKDAVAIFIERWRDLLIPIAEAVKASAIKYLEE